MRCWDGTRIKLIVDLHEQSYEVHNFLDEFVVLLPIHLCGNCSQ